MASILTPAITYVVKGEVDILVLLDSTEEEKKEKLKDVEDKIIENQRINNSYIDNLRKDINYVYFFNHSEHYVGINLPPPKLI